MQTKQNKTYIDYKAIREMGRRMDCTVTEADFNTRRPNPYRISHTVGDIARYKARVRRFYPVSGKIQKGLIRYDRRTEGA